MERITLEERRNRLAVRHRLATPAADVEAVATDLVGLHSSDPVSVYLSCRARISDFHVEDLERALYDDRSLLRLLGMRRTMFVVPRDLAGEMDAGCTKLLYAGERRRLVGYIEAQGIAADGARWLSELEAETLAALDDIGEATAKQLAESVPGLKTKLSFGEGKKWGGQIGMSTRVLFLLATQGAIIRARPLGTWVSTQYRWAKLEDWLGGRLDHTPTEKAQIALVRRWLRSYGPGTLNDIKWWTGWGLGVTRAALAGCDAVEVDLDGSPGYILPDDVALAMPGAPWVAFLPGLDPTVMGWKDRDWYLGAHGSELFDRNGNAGPTVWSSGRIVGGWVQAASGEIRFRLLEIVAAEERQLINEHGQALERWLGDRRFTTRFRTPLERELRG